MWFLNFGGIEGGKEAGEPLGAGELNKEGSPKGNLGGEAGVLVSETMGLEGPKVCGGTECGL